MNRTELSNSKKFYTYGHYLDGHLIYLGEGTGKRAWAMNKRPYKDRREEVSVRIFGIFDSKQLAVFNESLLIYQEQMEGNTHLLNRADYGAGNTGLTGDKNHRFQGLTIGTNRTTGTIIVFAGKKSMTDREFDHSTVYACINGRSKSYKNFTFIRTTDEEFLLQLLAEDNFHDEQSREILQNYLER